MEQNENKFFKYIWRFNALVISGAAVLCILLGSFAAIKVFRGETQERHVTNVVNVGTQEKAKGEFVLGYPKIDGADYVRIPLYRDQSYDMSYYSKSSGGNEVNYLFLNSSNNESKWLLENTNQLFISDIVLFDKLKNASAETNKAVGIVYTLVEKDSDGDGRLTNKDVITLSTSAIDGTNYRKLIVDIERLYSVKQIAHDKVLVLYQKNKETVYDLYSIPSMKQLSQRNIPQVNLK